MRPSRVPIALAFALASVAVAACGGAASVPPRGAPGSPAIAASPVATQAAAGTSGIIGGSGSCGADVATAIKAAAAAQSSASSYRIQGTLQSAGKPSPYLLEVQKPDRLHMIVGASEMIGIGSSTWRKVGTTWTEVPGLQLQNLVGDTGQLDATLVDQVSFTNVSVEPGTDGSGRPAILYRYHEALAQQLAADVQLWLDPTTCRPMRNASSRTLGSVQSSTDLTYSDWDVVTIQQPS